MKPGESQQFLGFQLVGTQVESLCDYTDAIEIRDSSGAALHTATWFGLWGARLWCVLHLRQA